MCVSNHLNRHSNPAARASTSTSIAGDDFVSFGTDWDGALSTRRDAFTCLDPPKLTGNMSQRGLSPESVQIIVESSALPVIGALRS
jgi:microsomal dipeptidase-like Zn-dependent dipeptidase